MRHVESLFHKELRCLSQLAIRHFSNFYATLHLCHWFTYLKLNLSHYTLWRRLGVRRYSSYSYSTSVLDWGEWSASRPGSALASGEGPPAPIVQEAGWAPEQVWTQRLEEKSFALPGIETRSPSLQACSQTLYLLSYPAHDLHSLPY
jgi:hypothetical protein